MTDEALDDGYETEEIPDLIVATIDRITGEKMDAVQEMFLKMMADEDAVQALQNFCNAATNQKDPLMERLMVTVYMVLNLIAAEQLAEERLEVTRGTRYCYAMHLCMRMFEGLPAMEVTNLEREKPN